MALAGAGHGAGTLGAEGGAGAVPWRPDSRVLLLGEGALMGLLEKRVNPCASHVFANSRSLKEQEPHLSGPPHAPPRGGPGLPG